MKIARKNHLTLALVALFALAASFTACKKSPEEIAALISNSEAAEIIEAAVAEKMGGITQPTIDLAQMVETLLDACGETGDTSYSKSKLTGVATYNCTWNMDWAVNCTQIGVPQDIAFGVDGAGAFANARWSGENTTTGDIKFTGLDLQAPELIANGSYTLVGDLTGALRKTSPNLEVTTQLTLTDLKVAKITYDITGGTGTFIITAKAKNAAESITLTGSLVFNGDGTATVKVNDHEQTFSMQ